MKLKKLLAILLALLLVFTLSACSGQDNKSSKDEDASSLQDSNSSGEQSSDLPDSASTPLLYKATDANGNVAWIFGSIHVGRESFYPLPSAVMDAFDSADMLAVEFDVIAFEKDMTAQTDAVMAMMYSDMSQISQHLDKEVYDEAVKVLEKEGLYSSYLDFFCPAIWSNFIDSVVYEKVGLDINGGIDRYFIERAYEQNKKVDDVESAELQYSMLANFSDELQEILLAQSIMSYEQVQTTQGTEEYLAELGELMDAWQKGDEAEIYSLANEPGEMESAEEQMLYDEYQYAMITERNIGMADYAEEALSSGKTVFICVGAAHVVGDGGIADLLRERGYTVEVVR